LTFTPGAGLISNLVTIGPGSTSSTVASIPKSFNFNSSNLESASKDSCELPYFSFDASSSKSKLGNNESDEVSNNLDCLSVLAFLPSSIGGAVFSIFGFDALCCVSLSGNFLSILFLTVSALMLIFIGLESNDFKYLISLYGSQL